MKKTGNKWYSGPLMKQNIRSNRALTVVIIIVMILMCTIINYATSMMDKGENMSKMDTGSMINQMYYTVTGLLPILLYIVIVANGLIVNQIDQGSMAYVLSTPTKRSAIAITQAIFMVVVPFIMIGIACVSRIISNYVLYDDGDIKKTLCLYGGMYILIEAISGICYMSSCIFDYSRKAIALGGGVTVWFFLASLLGMFGGDDLVDMGIGVEELGIFNRLTLIGLYDIKSISTIVTDDVDYSFVWKLAVLVLIAIVTYVVGAVRFQKKDLPL